MGAPLKYREKPKGGNSKTPVSPELLCNTLHMLELLAELFGQNVQGKRQVQYSEIFQMEMIHMTVDNKS